MAYAGPEIRLPDGRTGYWNPYSQAYTTSRSYAMRLQRGYAQGVSRQQARRGIRSWIPGMSEAQNRAQAFQDKYGISYNYWRRIQRKYLTKIVAMDPSIGYAEWRLIIYEDLARLQSFPATGIIGQRRMQSPEQQNEAALASKLEAMEAYRRGDVTTGRNQFDMRVPYRPIELWWYH